MKIFQNASKIYWPLNNEDNLATQCTSRNTSTGGFLIGYLFSPLVVVVTSLVPEQSVKDYTKMKSYVKQFGIQAHGEQMPESEQFSQLSVLGRYYTLPPSASSEKPPVAREIPAEFANPEDLDQISFFLGLKHMETAKAVVPVFVQIFQGGHVLTADSAQIILYHQNPNQFLTNNFDQLACLDVPQSGSTITADAPSSPDLKQQQQGQQKHQQQQQSEFSQCLSFLNFSFEASQRLNQVLKSQNRKKVQVNDQVNYLDKDHAPTKNGVAAAPVVLALSSLWPLQKLKSLPGFSRLCKFSNFVAQLEKKANLASEMTSKASFLQKNSFLNTRTIKLETLKFSKSGYMILTDVFLGLILSLILIVFGDLFLEVSRNFFAFFTDIILVQNINWLMGWPAGLKLNDNLDQFLGTIFLFYIHIWTSFINYLFSMGQVFLILQIISGLFGLSVSLALSSDILVLCSFQVTCTFIASAKIYDTQSQVLSSLWNLFRGKKWNPLRKRTDSIHFDIDQLLLGTFCFTLVFFLIPTAAVYYLFFGLVALLIKAVVEMLLFAVHLLNTFPIYYLYLTKFRPSNIPGGVFFSVLGGSADQIGLSLDDKRLVAPKGLGADVSTPSPSLSKISYLQIKNKPVSWTRVLVDVVSSPYRAASQKQK